MKKFLGVVATTVAALALSTTAANAAPAGNVVMFGDSFFAIATYAQVGGIHAAPGSSDMVCQGQPGSPSPQGCTQGHSNIGNELKKFGHDVVNMACSSAKAGGTSKRSNMQSQRSEERRVGKERRSREARPQWKKRGLKTLAKMDHGVHDTEKS